MWLKKLPKIELHCHLDGSIPISTLKKLCYMENISIPENEDAFRKLIEVNDDCKSLLEYLKAFDLPLKCLKTEKAFFIASYETAVQASKEGVRYLELRFSPLLSEHQNLSSEKIIEACISGLKKAYADTGIIANLILCGMRHFSEKDNLRILELAKKYLNIGVCGVDLAGDEAGFNNELFEGYFRKAYLQNIPFTIHSGECGRKKNIELAIKYGAKRIGHGIAMQGDKELQKEVIKNGIGIEMCPSSNLQTKAALSFNEYPFNEFFEQGVNISINTDNRTVTNTSIIKELKISQKYFNLSKSDIVTLMEQSLKVSFANADIKKILMNELDEWKKEFIQFSK